MKLIKMTAWLNVINKSTKTLSVWLLGANVIPAIGPTIIGGHYYMKAPTTIQKYILITEYSRILHNHIWILNLRWEIYCAEYEVIDSGR